MIKHLRLIIFLIVVAPFTSCHVGVPHEDIAIINKSTDSLYYQITGFNEVKFPIRNPAYEEFTDGTTNKSGFQLMKPDFAPGNTEHPFLIDTTWKLFAAVHHGITILLFKKEVQKLQRGNLWVKNVIFRRYDFTTKQLDSIKYTIIIK